MAGLLICSDIHGDAISAKKIVDAFESHKAERLVILGDILYHGPRNDLPAGYAPKKVIEIHNPYSDKILAVRGNCDAEVDQMVLSFPILADYAFIERDGLRFFATHGHVINKGFCPQLRKGDILLHGHTHVPVAEKFGDDILYVNPGSTSIPKENSPKSYIYYENRELHFMTLDSEEYRTVKI
jgi:putative phosphoesterase